METTRIDRHNRKVRKWANRQPPKYRKSALAFGYRCNAESATFSGTLAWISQLSRRYGYGVSRRTLAYHLKEFQRWGVVEVTRNRRGDKNTGSYYRVHFDRAIGQEYGEVPERDSAIDSADLIAWGSKVAARSVAARLHSGEYGDQDICTLEDEAPDSG